jgi:outer membrane protein TolC
MIFKVRRVIFYLLPFCIAVSISGCTSPGEYKSQADKEVYKIIDSKWQDNFGKKANYTVSDVPAGANDIKLDKETPSGIISLAKAVAIATANNRDYQAQKESLYSSALVLTLSRHQFVTQWFGTIDGAYSNNAGEESLSSGFGVGFNRMLADGASISTSIAFDWMRFLTSSPSETLGSVLSASITQPLLRGAGRKVVQENLTQAERNVLYNIRSFNRYRQQFVVTIISDYYNVLQLRDSVVNAKNSYRRKVELTDRLRMEAEIGKTPQFQVDQAEQSELSEKDRYLRIEQSYQQALDQFKIELALPTSAAVELDPNELQALVKKGVQQPDYTLQNAVETAMLQRLDLANSFDSVDDAYRKVEVAVNNLKADLNVTASTKVSSEEPREFDNLQFNLGNYNLGLSADLPFDRKSERNTYRQTLINFQKKQRDYEQAKSDVELNVRQAYRTLQEEAESYITQKKSLDLAQQRVDMSPLLWATGRATTRDILEAQDALLSAQNQVTAALVSHTVAKLNFFRDIGVLQVKPDGMWE